MALSVSASTLSQSVSSEGASNSERVYLPVDRAAAVCRVKLPEIITDQNQAYQAVFSVQGATPLFSYGISTNVTSL